LLLSGQRITKDRDDGKGRGDEKNVTWAGRHEGERERRRGPDAKTPANAACGRNSRPPAARLKRA
jgi:hypothetical protein